MAIERALCKDGQYEVRAMRRSESKEYERYGGNGVISHEPLHRRPWCQRMEAMMLPQYSPEEMRAQASEYSGKNEVRRANEDNFVGVVKKWRLGR